MSLRQPGSNNGVAACSMPSRHMAKHGREVCQMSLYCQFTLMVKASFGMFELKKLRGGTVFIKLQEGILVYFADDIQSCEQASQI